MSSSSDLYVSPLTVCFTQSFSVSSLFDSEHACCLLLAHIRSAAISHSLSRWPAKFSQHCVKHCIISYTLPSFSEHNILNDSTRLHVSKCSTVVTKLLFHNPVVCHRSVNERTQNVWLLSASAALLAFLGNPDGAITKYTCTNVTMLDLQRDMQIACHV